jgi:hypothetical protein
MYIARGLLLVTTLVAVFSTSAQVAPPDGEGAGQPSGHFPVMLLKTHSILTQSAIRPAWEMQPGGELTVGNSSIEFHNPADPKASFAFPISRVRSLERRRGPEGFPVLRIKLVNGKNFDLVPDFASQRPATGENGKSDPAKTMNEGVDAMEKAIRDMGAENKVVLK